MLSQTSFDRWLATRADRELKDDSLSRRRISARTAVTVLESRNGWSLIASAGKPIGYVATRDLAPIRQEGQGIKQSQVAFSKIPDYVSGITLLWQSSG
jgi:hypothetical protein